MSTAILVVAAITLAGAKSGEDTRWVVASVANVRSAPSANAALAGKLGIGAKVVVGRCAKQFCHVRAPRSGGLSGYVAESLLDRSPPNFPALMDDAVRALERACALSPDDRGCLAALEAAYRADGNDDAATRVAILLKRKNEKGSLRAQQGGPMVHDTGMHHGEEALAQDGEKWFALCGDDFRAVTVEVRAVRDELLDAPREEATGREISVPCEAELLLKGIRGFSPDKVRRAALRDDGSFALGSERIALQSEKGHAVFVDVTSGKRQTLGAYDNEGSDTPPHVLFAGDLDGDGKLDFIASYSEHYNVRALHLFLSSAADGWAPKEVYEHRDTGC